MKLTERERLVVRDRDRPRRNDWPSGEKIEPCVKGFCKTEKIAISVLDSNASREGVAAATSQGFVGERNDGTVGLSDRLALVVAIG